MLYLIVRGVLVGLMRVLLRVRIGGQQHVPAAGGFILAPTHRSNIDFMLAGALTRRRLRFMTKDAVWRSRVLGAIVEHLGGFPVNRGTPDRAAIATSVAALAAGEGVVLFPEGQRRSGAAVEDLHDGVAYLAARAHVPIIPVGIAGSEQAQPPGRFTIKPLTRIRVEVGPPLMPPAPNGTRVARSTIRGLTKELQTELQRLHNLASADPTDADKVS